MTGERRRQISILLTILALLLWSHSVLYARFEIGHFGLISGLPVTFFVALALLTVASAILWVAKEKYGKLLGLQLLILILALYSVPLITGGSAPFINHGYRNLGYVDYIVGQNHFDTQVTFYLSWPGAFILSAMIAKIGLINFEPLIEVLPIFLPILFLLPLYVFLKNTLGEARSNYVWAGCWLYYLASWGGPGNLISTMGTAFFLLVVILAVVTNPRLWQTDGKSLALLSLIVIVFAAMVTTHLLTSLAALGIMAALFLVRRDKRLALVVGVCFAILLAWNLTVARDFVLNRIPIISEGAFIFDLGVLGEREVTGHLLGGGAHIDIVRIRLLFVGIFVLIGLAGAILAFVARRDFKTNLSLLAITVTPLVLVTLSGFYAKEILTRVYAFVLPGIAYFGANLLALNKRVVVAILCLILIMAIPLHVIASYGNAELDYFSPAERTGLFFFHDKTTQGFVFGAWPIGMAKNIEQYRTSDLERLEWKDNRLVIPKWTRQYLPYYIGISRQDRVRYEWLWGNTQLIGETEQRLQSTVNCDFIYNNPNLKLYICEGG